MTLEELKQKIEEGNGVYEPIDNLTFKYNEEKDTIHIHCDREEEKGGGFIMLRHNTDLSGTYLSCSEYLKDINKFIRFVKLLTEALDYDLQIETVVEKEVKVEVEKIVIEEKTQGMIEAYEKILFGRKVTLENNNNN